MYILYKDLLYYYIIHYYFIIIVALNLSRFEKSLILLELGKQTGQCSKVHTTREILKRGTQRTLCNENLLRWFMSLIIQMKLETEASV